MKKLCMIGFTLVFVGCSRSTQEHASFTAEQARAAAVQLANAKAKVLYQCSPFTDRQPAQFSQGRWVWSDRQGLGQSDFEATVEFGANGATNRVDVQMLINRTALRRF